MASYEDDHNLRTPPAPSRRRSSPRRSRLNINEFFQRLQSSSSSSASTPSVEHLLASYSSLAVSPILEHLITTLREDPHSVSGKGVPEGWTDSLERVNKKLLKPEDTCPICSSAFLDDPFPLVVRLPCHGKHIFDLECLAVWLKINATCPLDRTDLLKKKPEPPPPPPEEKEEEWDDTYG